jgi:pSer/pThr/pTyr-binding forkhead associated (FHA) protein
MVAQTTLTATAGGLTGEQFILSDQAPCVVGRSRGCTLRLPVHDLLASRQHCLLSVHGPRIGVVDLDSLNGTYVNGQRIGQARLIDVLLRTEQPIHWLADGDELQVGQTVFLVQIGEEGSGAEALSEHRQGQRDTQEALLAG